MADNNINMDPKDTQQTPETTLETQLPEAIKVGEKAYTQEELQNLVGLGEQARELETKWNTKVDRLMPEYTKSRQELADLKKQQEESMQRNIQQRQQEGQTLTPEELKRQAATQLRELMQDPTISEYINQQVASQQAAKSLIDDTEFIIEDYVDQGLPKTTTEELLQYMADNGFKNPDKAYRDMFNKEVIEHEANQLQELKNKPITTMESGFNTGGKEPPTGPTPRNRQELAKALSDYISGGA